MCTVPSATPSCVLAIIDTVPGHRAHRQSSMLGLVGGPRANHRFECTAATHQLAIVQHFVAFPAVLLHAKIYQAMKMVLGACVRLE